MKIRITVTPKRQSIQSIQRAVENLFLDEKVKDVLSHEEQRFFPGGSLQSKFISNVFRYVYNLGVSKRWESYLKSEAFAKEFGVTPSQAKEYAKRWRDLWGFGNKENAAYVRNFYSVVKKNNYIEIKLFNQDVIRQELTNIWFSKAKLNLSSGIFVNAWDIYEYGKIGSSTSGGKINDYIIKTSLSRIERQFSRSKLALMKKAPGKSFTFGELGGESPKIGEFRFVLKSHFSNDLLLKRIIGI